MIWFSCEFDITATCNCYKNMQAWLKVSDEPKQATDF